MIPTSLTNEETEWSIAVLIASVFTFLIALFYIYAKRGAITRSVFISAVTSLSSAAIICAHNKGADNIAIEAIFVLRGIQYAFAFYPMLYAFYRLINRVDGEDIPLVYIGYIWMVVTLGVSFAATIMVKNIDSNYDLDYSEDLENVIKMTFLSSWGFIAVIILLYIRNSKHFDVDGEIPVIGYILLVLIQAITTTIFLCSPPGSIDVYPAAVFILIDLTMDIAIIIAVHYGSVWAGDKLKVEKSNVNTNAGDLEANHGYN